MRFVTDRTEHAPNSTMVRHRHDRAYAALVLGGGFVEAGHGRRIEARPGNVIVHPLFSAHSNWFQPRGAQVLNFALPRGLAKTYFKVGDPDHIVRLFERDRREATDELINQLVEIDPTVLDWPDELADSIASDENLSILDWSHERGLHPASVSRGFRKVYGVSPKRFRLEIKMSRAAEMLVSTNYGAALIASECGFSDQPHMCRTFRSLINITPGQIEQTSFNRLT